MQNILIDLSNLGFACAAGKTTLTAGSLDTGTAFTLINMIRRIVENHPGRVLALYDGRSWRHAEIADYKAGRESSEEGQRIRARWTEAKPMIARLLKALGVIQVLAPNLEADDLAALLSGRIADAGHNVLLVTHDKDWLQLLRPGVIVFDPNKNGGLITLANLREKTGLPSPFALAERKALMGKSQELPGIGGIGEKTANWILENHHSVEGFVSAATLDKEVYAASDRRARVLVDNPDKLQAYRDNIRLAWLRHPDVPKPDGMKVVNSGFDRDAFRTVCQDLSFFSILRNFETWVRPFESPAVAVKEAA